MPASADPLASLTLWPVDVVIGGKVYSIPPTVASGWLLALYEEFGTFDTIIELLPIGQKSELEQDVIDDKITYQEREEAFRDAVEVVAGRPWWQVLNYLNLIRGHWARFHGRLLMSGLDPDRVSLGAYLDAAHYSFIANLDEQQAQKIQNFLDTPPPGVEIEIDQDAEGQTFLSMLNSQR